MLHDPLHESRLHQAANNDKQGSDENHRRRGESAENLASGNDTADKQQHHAAKKNKVGGELGE